MTEEILNSERAVLILGYNAHNYKLASWPELDCVWVMSEAMSSPFLSCTYVQYLPWLKGSWKKLRSHGAKQGRHLQSICELTGLITLLMSQANLKRFWWMSVGPQLWWFIIANNVDTFLAMQDSWREILNKLNHFYYQTSVCSSCLDRVNICTSHRLKVTIKTEQLKVWKVKMWKALITHHALLTLVTSLSTT